MKIRDSLPLFLVALAAGCQVQEPLAPRAVVDDLTAFDDDPVQPSTSRVGHEAGHRGVPSWPGEDAALAVMGDSTSLDDEAFQGYANHLAREIGPDVVVVWPGENGRTSASLLAQVETWAPIRWGDLVVFNAGLHDIARVDGVSPQVGLGDYVSNLTLMLEHFDEMGVEPVWRSTTPVPADYTHSDLRLNDDVLTYNAAAAQLMEDWSVPIVDLYEFTLPNLDRWQRPADVHFESAGNHEMSMFLAASLRDEFGDGLGAGP